MIMPLTVKSNKKSPRTKAVIIPLGITNFAAIDRAVSNVNRNFLSGLV